MDISCPSCHSAVFDAGDKYVCEKMDQCPGDFKVWGKVAGYEITPEDLAVICAGDETPEREMISKAGKSFHASLVWDATEHKVAFKFENTRETLEGVVCPDHGCELRGSEKRYYCPTKISEGVWCPVGSWRTIGSHVVTKEELADLLDGVPVGPWEMRRRDGSGTYQVLAEYDFDENKVNTDFYNSASRASEQYNIAAFEPSGVLSKVAARSCNSNREAVIQSDLEPPFFSSDVYDCDSLTKRRTH